MMKALFLFLFLAFSVFASAQGVGEVSKQPPPDNYTLIHQAPAAQICYAPLDSNLIGLCLLDGKEILPCRYYNIMNYPVAEPVKDNLVFLLDTNRSRYAEMGFEVKKGYEVKAGAYTRGGLLLYEPYWYDNGVDYFTEGRQRFVYNNRMGFVNRFGEVTVEAQYPLVLPYKNGVAFVCYNCVYTILDSTDTEHGAGFVGSEWGLIDKKGKTLKKFHLDKNALAEDSLQQIPLPVTANEKALSQKLLALLEIKLFAKQMDVPLQGMRMVLYDKPNKRVPYYHFGLQDSEGSYDGNDYQFLISPDGRSIRHLPRMLQWEETLAEWRLTLEKEGNQ